MPRVNELKVFQDAGALLEGHFLLSSGLHSAQYLQCALLLRYPSRARKLCSKLAAKFRGKRIEAVVGPAYGGIIVAYELARALGARALFTERKDGRMQLRRGFKIKQGERILVAEDVVTTGGSVKELLRAIRPYKPKIIAIAALIDRKKGQAPFGKICFKSLKRIKIKAYKPKDCPLCKRGIALVKPGSRAKE